MNGKVIYKEEVYGYELDDEGTIWITLPSRIGKINIGQYRPVSKLDDINSVVLEMLEKGGF
jgi:hypothetical protein